MPLVKAVCTNCGANLEVDNSKDAAICPMCGTPYIVEKAIQKYNTYISSTDVNAINEAGFKKLLDAANGFMALNDYNNAKNTFEQITREYPQKFEGWWGVGMLELELEKVSHKEDSINPGFSCVAIENAKRLASKEQLKIINEKVDSFNEFALAHNKSIEKNKKRENDDRLRRINEQVGSFDEFVNVLKRDNCYYRYERYIRDYYTIAYNKTSNGIIFSHVLENDTMPACTIYHYEIYGWDSNYNMEGVNGKEIEVRNCFNAISSQIVKDCGSQYKYRARQEVNNSISPINLTLKRVEGDGSIIISFGARDICMRRQSLPNNATGCYIATCVYGSYDCPQVWTLRRYRDNFLQKNTFGRAFIRCYYAISPKLVKLFGNQKWFHTIWKGYLDKKIEALRNAGYEDTPYDD